MENTSPATLPTGRPEGLLVRAWEALRGSEARFQAFMRRCPTLCWMTDADGRMLYVNEAWCATLGFEADAVVGRLLREIFPVSVADELAANNREALARDSCLEVTERVPASDGLIHEFIIYKFPVPDGAGGVVAGGMAVDITKRQAEERLRQRDQKLESAALLAEGLAHNFSQVLALIRGHAEILQEREDLDAAARRSVDRIATAAAGAAQLTRQLLAFSRKQATAVVLYEAGAVVKRMAELIVPVLGAGVALVVDVSDEALVVEGDPSALEQILLNLAMNARDALGETGRLELRAGAARAKNGGNLVCIEVMDTGRGIAPENLDRVWNPFFTTKQDDGGGGLGLATVYGLVLQHGGQVRVASELGRGTTFTVDLPRVG